MCFIGRTPVHSRGDPIDGRATVTFDASGGEGRRVIGSGKEDGGGGIGGGSSAGGGGWP